MKNKKQTTVSTIKETDIYVCLVLLILVPLLLNWKIIHYDFTKLDDSSIITNNKGFLSDFNNVFKAFEKDNFITEEGRGYYRPIQTLSFMIDAHISGDEPQAYHFMNLFYHILTAISLFFLLRLFGIKNNISLFLSLLFAIHPLFTNALDWIVGRADILSGLFGTVSFIFFIKYSDNKNKLFYFIHNAAFALALFSKEISISLPIVLVFYFWFVKNNKYNVRKLLSFIASWSLIVVVFFYLRYRFINPQDLISIESFIKNLPVIPILFAKLFFPFNLSPMPIFTVPYAAGGIVLALLLSIYIIKSKLFNTNIIMLGLVWFIVFILPGMLVRTPLARYHFEYLECRAYLPSIGIFIAAGILLSVLIKKNENRMLISIGIPLILVFSILTFIYSDVYSNPMDFYTSVINSNAENVYALCSRGSLYSAARNVNPALADFDKSIKIVTYYSEPYYDKATLYNSIGNHLLAEKYYSDALNYDTLYPNLNNLHEYAYIGLSSEKLNLKKYQEAKEILIKAEVKYPKNRNIHNNLGLVLYSEGKYASALKEYNLAKDHGQNTFSYYNKRGMARYQLKDFGGALEDFNASLNLNPEFRDARINRGIVKIDLKDYEGAISDLTVSIKSNPENGIAWYFRGVAYSKLNRSTEAEENLQNANKLGFKIPLNKTGK